jgi:hypothetical protein
MRPVPMSIMRAPAWSAISLARAITVNSLFGIAELALLAVLSCLIYYTPFFVLDRVRPK